MILNFPPPANWQDFQTLTVRLVEQLCDPTTVREYGTQGQSQDGVDVYGEMPGGLHLGVQCKKIKPGKKLTKAIIEAEANSALSFNPPLTTFVIATTLDEDTGAHDAVVDLYKASIYPFKISYWSWKHFNDKLNRSNQLVQDSYQQYAQAFGLNEELEDLKRLREAFDRPAFIDDFRRELSVTNFREALGDTVLFLQTGMLRDRKSTQIISATYAMSMLPKGKSKQLRTQLEKDAKELRRQAAADLKAGLLDARLAAAYNALRYTLLSKLNRALVASGLQEIHPDY